MTPLQIPDDFDARMADPSPDYIEVTAASDSEWLALSLCSGHRDSADPDDPGIFLECGRAENYGLVYMDRAAAERLVAALQKLIPMIGE